MGLPQPKLVSLIKLLVYVASRALLISGICFV